MEYNFNAWKGPELGIGLEFRKDASFPVPPGEILVTGKARYPVLLHWEVGCSFRGLYQQKEFEGVDGFMNDRNRITLDAYYFRKRHERKSKFQLRFRYQYSWDAVKHDHYGRLRMKWKQKSFKTFRPYASTEFIYAGFYPLPDACRIRIGMETRLTRSTQADAFYQAEIRCKQKHEIMQYALGAAIYFESH